MVLLDILVVQAQDTLVRTETWVILVAATDTLVLQDPRLIFRVIPVVQEVEPPGGTVTLEVEVNKDLLDL
jgi:hypothetical protein